MQLNAFLGGVHRGPAAIGLRDGPAIAASESSRAQVSAAYRAAAEAELTSIHRSASRCLIAWYEPIARPNCLRSLAYASVVSKHHCATPSCSDASNAAPVCQGRRDRGSGNSRTHS